jgi:hypothetical protein
MQLFSEDATTFKKKMAPKNMKKPTSKVAHNQPNFFSVLPTPFENAKRWLDKIHSKLCC